MRHFHEAASSGRYDRDKDAAVPMPEPYRPRARRFGAWRQLFAVPLFAVALLLSSVVGTEAATFELNDGSSIEGEIVHVTRNTLMLRLMPGGGLRQLSRHDLKSVTIETEAAGAVQGNLESWRDGIYELQADGQLMQLKNGRVVAESELKPPLLSIANTEGSESTAALTFDLTLSRPSKQPILVIYATLDRSAIAGEDFEGSRGSITLKPGDTSAQIEVPLIDNDVAGEDKYFEVFIATDQKVATIQSKRAVGTIVNDDKGAALGEDDGMTEGVDQISTVEGGEEISLKETE